MLRNPRLLLLGGVFVIALALMVWSLRPTTISAEELQSLGVVVLPEPVQLAELDLIDENGETFDRRNLEGKWSFGFFGYTHCPDICPTTLAQMSQVVQQLESQGDTETLDNIQQLFISVDPNRDDAATVKKYTDQIDESLIGVTGSPADIRAFATSVYVGYGRLGDPSATEDYLVNHQGNIIIFDRSGNGYGFIKSPFDNHHLARIFAGLARIG